MADKLYERFVKGAEDLGVSAERLMNFYYCGSSKPEGVKYFKQFFKGKVPIPETDPKCICGSNIEHTYWITDRKVILTVGSCCIRRYIAACGKTCEDCGSEHKNRTMNKCNTCKQEYRKCEDCDEIIPKKYTRCITHHRLRVIKPMRVVSTRSRPIPVVDNDKIDGIHCSKCKRIKCTRGSLDMFCDGSCVTN
jgi:hypothetical protein